MASRALLLTLSIPALAQKQVAGGAGDYTSQYAGDYQKYMQGQGQSKGSQGGAGDYMSQYAADYQKYMQSSQAKTNENDPVSFAAKAHESQSKGSQGGAGDYMSQYAGDYQKYMQGQGQGKGSQGGAGDYISQHAADHQKYMQGQGKGSDGDVGKNMAQHEEIGKSFNQEARNASEETKPNNLAAIEPQLLDGTSASELQNVAKDAADKVHKEASRLETERQEEKQHLEDKLAEEKERFHKEIDNEKHILQQELKREAQEEKGDGSTRTPEMLALEPAGRGAVPAVLAALFAAAAIIGLRRHTAQAEAASDDYMVYLEPPLAAV